jgi:hypothetical protein
MKKILAFILLVIYLPAYSGVVVNFHYCMNRLASTQFFSTEKKVCGKCGMHTGRSHGCCRDEVKVVKLTIDQLSAKTLTITQTPVIPVQHISDFLAVPVPCTAVPEKATGPAPPLLSDQDNYLQFSVFRI